MKIINNKNLILNLFTLSILTITTLSSCKKEETSTSNSPTISAPNCLVTAFTGSYNGSFKYDDLRRIIESSTQNDSSKTTFAYQGNKMIETTSYTSSDGKVYTYVTIHTLNSSGYVIKSVQTPTDPNYTSENEFTYSNDGYLLREMDLSTYKSPMDSMVQKYYYGKSYTYENGNQTKVYSLKFDDSGNVTDSTLTQVTVYDLSLPGKLEQFTAWLSRKGKANKNEIKTVEYFDEGSSEIDTHTYTIDSNGNPSSLKITGANNSVINITWNCK
jgi:hypothetical protein